MGNLQPILFMVLMFGVFWFILIRPQQKRQREHASMLNALQKGDEVVTRGGIIGTITGVADGVVTLQLQEKVRVKVLKSYIESKTTTAPGTAPSKATKAEPGVPTATE